MSEMSPIRNMAAVRKPRATGRVKKSDNALMVGFLERVGGSKEVSWLKTRLLKKRSSKQKLALSEDERSIQENCCKVGFLGNKIRQTTLVRDMEKL